MTAVNFVRRLVSNSRNKTYICTFNSTKLGAVQMCVCYRFPVFIFGISQLFSEPSYFSHPPLWMFQPSTNMSKTQNMSKILFAIVIAQRRERAACRYRSASSFFPFFSKPIFSGGRSTHKKLFFGRAEIFTRFRYKLGKKKVRFQKTFFQKSAILSNLQNVCILKASVVTKHLKNNKNLIF